jgi:hypothetical protein
VRFNRYSRGKIVARPFDHEGGVDLRRSDGTGLLRTNDGIPRAVIDASALDDVVAILSCIAGDFDVDGCRLLGVEVTA